MSHPKWFKLGGFRLRDLRSALDMEEETLIAVNRQVRLQLHRLKQEFEVLVRRKANLDRDRKALDGVARADDVDHDDEGDDRAGTDNSEDGDDSDSRDHINDAGRDERTAPVTRKRSLEAKREHRTEKKPKRKTVTTHGCGYCGNPNHKTRTCPDKNR